MKQEIPWNTTRGMLNLEAMFEVQGRQRSEIMQLGNISNWFNHFSSGSLSRLLAAMNRGINSGEGRVSMFSHP